MNESKCADRTDESVMWNQQSFSQFLNIYDPRLVLRMFPAASTEMPFQR